ncbi:MAG: type II secretion system F family protein [Janthinobacterium lividum]
MNSQILGMLAICLLAAAMLLVGGSLLIRGRLLGQHARNLETRLEARAASLMPSDQNIVVGTVEDDRPLRQRLLDRLAEIGERGVGSTIGRQLVADDDRSLLDTCGVNDARGQALFFVARFALGIALPIIALLILHGGSPLRTAFVIFGGFAVGYMVPKLFMSRYAARRRTKADDELPLFIDLLRLLQGVGLSVDQSLHLIEHEFKNVLPVFGQELELASNQYASGRTRELSLQRLATVFDNEDMSSIVRLIVQVDRYGGAVQEPLGQFSDRIRERRKLELKTRIGKLTVKMTGVMVVTLLPALMTITGGAGFLAIIHAFSQMGGHR